MSTYKNIMMSSKSRDAVISSAASLFLLFLSLVSNFCLASYSIISERISINDSINVEYPQPAQIYINSGTTIIGLEELYNAKVINRKNTRQCELKKQVKQISIREAKEKNIAKKKIAVSSPDLTNLSKYISDHSLQKNSLTEGFITILVQNQNLTKKYFGIKPICIYAYDNTCVYHTNNFRSFKTMKNGMKFFSSYLNRGPPVLI